MFEIVKTARQQRRFAETWEYFCALYGWYNDPYAKNGIRYNLLNPNKRKIVIGTIEFIPYDPKNPNSTVEGRWAFSQYTDIRDDQERVWEIDKLCLHKDYQRKGYFKHFWSVFYHHMCQHQPKYYIGLMEKRLFRMMRICFGLAVEQRGESLPGQSTELVPVIFDVEQIMQNQEAVNRFFGMSPYKSPRRNRIFLTLQPVLKKIARR
ncbi:hypothetical protein J14TS2_36820 [Bacillus sp. J14TS2]|uniref:hypothetical protein n=1 Tax=Bacillus sp. J14TS2 TaxID=2807188 RepID=UPI001AFF8848|nr:hypothetical protein [Bacillus sp. J14TS2]GIN73207.1 hypothetical protein J14TS2_36820 [Bacillus sp. J14TS2]